MLNNKPMLDNEQKKQIDEMSYYNLMLKWRFAKTGDPLLQGETGEYFAKVLQEKESKLAPGEKVAVSKLIGWGNG